MYKFEQVLFVLDDLEVGFMDLYLSVVEFQFIESLLLEFSDDLDVVGDGMLCLLLLLFFDFLLIFEDYLVIESVGDVGQMQVVGDGCRFQGV